RDSLWPLAGRRPALVRVRPQQVRTRDGMASQDQCRRRHSAAASVDFPESPGSSGSAGGRIMKVALINPNWSFEGSIYFGCREPHLPLEYGYARALLTDAGHDAAIFDAQIDGIDTA